MTQGRAVTPQQAKGPRDGCYADEEGAAAGGADGRGGEDVGVAHAVSRQAVEMGRAHVLGAVTAQIEFQVLPDDPKNIGELEFSIGVGQAVGLRRA